MYDNFLTPGAGKTLAPLIASKSTQNVHATIDKLTLVFDLDWPERNLLDLTKHVDHIRYLPSKNKRIGYQYTIETASGLHVDLAPYKHPNLQDVRMEFNPNKFDPEGTLFFPLLNHAKWLRATRIDYAIDFPEDLSLYRWDTDNMRKKVKFESPNGNLETLYLGMSTSPDFYRIYDKAKEQDEPGTLWRIEHVFKLTTKQHYTDLKPFDNLFGWRPDTFTGDYHDDVILADLFDNPRNFSRLSRRKQEHYRKLMKDHSRTVHQDITPATVYKATCQPLNNFLWNLMNNRTHV